MCPHLSLNVRNVPASVEFYQKVFGVSPAKDERHNPAVALQNLLLK